MLAHQFVSWKQDCYFPISHVSAFWFVGWSFQVPNSIVYLPPRPLWTSFLMLKICEAPQVQPENTSGDATEVGQNLKECLVTTLGIVEQLKTLVSRKTPWIVGTLVRCHLKNPSPSRRWATWISKGVMGDFVIWESWRVFCFFFWEDYREVHQVAKQIP